MNPDDPKLTAYALDELDPADRAEVDQLLREHPEMLAEVEETERLAAQLRRELQAEPAAPLTAEQRAEIFSAAAISATSADPVTEPGVVAANIVPLCRTWSRPLALAASVAVLAGVTYLAFDSLQERPGRREMVAFSAAPAPTGGSAAASPTTLDADPTQPAVTLDLAAENPAPTKPRPSLAGPSPEPASASPLGAPASGLPGELPELTRGLAEAPVDLAKSKQQLLAAETDYRTGRYDRALRQTDQILAGDPANLPAQQLQEQVQTAVDEYAAAGYNETRSRFTLNKEIKLPDGTTSSAGQPASAAMPDPGAKDLFTSREAAGEGRDLASVEEKKLLAPAKKPSTPLAANAPARFGGGGSGGAGSEYFGSETRAAGASSLGKGDAAASTVLADANSSPKPTTAPAEPGLPEHSAELLGIADPQAKSPAGRGRAAAALSPKSPRTLAVTGALAFGGRVALNASPEAELRPGDASEIATKSVASSIEEVRRQREPGNTEAYDAIQDNAFLRVGDHPHSTFSIDVDTASYSNVRRFLNEQRLPPRGAVRIEELINYFDYEYPQPEGDAPFSASMEVAACPWTPEHRLVRIGLKGREIHAERRPASNLVFLIDVSGSMQPENKLPLVKKSLRQLVDKLGGEDTVAMVVYAGSSGCVLEPTNKKSEMRAALDRLESGGSTNGAAGIQLAYQLAERSFIKGGVNRVILATDGDFNVGVTNQSDLIGLIEKKAKSGVFLTVLGFGMGNLKDSTLEKLADKGNGNYAYIDTFNEARKVLVEQMSGTLVTIAKDVKIQVEFNPAQVGSYRLIGYENRMLKKEDFNDDTKDAGEIGAGHTVTALYEIVPAGKGTPGTPAVDALKYQQAPAPQTVTPTRPDSRELLTLKLRYKAPDGDTSKLLEFPLVDEGRTYEQSSRDFRFAAAVASFGMLLRDSPHKGKANWNSTLELAAEGKGEDRNGYRAEFVSLVERAKAASR